MNNNKLTNSQLGDLGERIAGQFLERNNLNIIDRNFRTRWGEIDIITMSNMSLRFIEVKTKGLSVPFVDECVELVKVDSPKQGKGTGSANLNSQISPTKFWKGSKSDLGYIKSEFDNPLHRVNMQKFQRMKKAAYIYLSKNMPHILDNDLVEINFDVLSIVVNVSLNRAQIVWYKNYLN